MRRWPFGLAAAAALVLGVGVTALAAGGGNAKHNDPEHPDAVPTTVGPTISIDRLSDGRVSWDKPIHVEVSHGTLTDVEVIDDAGDSVYGMMAQDSLSWQSNHTLIPAASYTLKATAVDSSHHEESQTVVLKATDTDKHLSAVISPGDGDTVGVGMPVAVIFNQAIPKNQQANVERRIALTTTPAVQGAWHWLRPNEAHWRPAAYWASGTKVSVQANLIRLDLGNGLWGVDNHSATFTIGETHVSTANIATHQMTVTSNGQTVRVLPMSAGRDKYPTKGGVHIALEKSQVVTMDSQTVGIPRNSPDGYYEKVYWDVRISNGGAFVHAAPWSVGAQGHSNVSHGCVNLSTADAEWFYGFAQRGDIVNVVNSPASPDLGDPGMADWNISWDAWRNSDPLNAATA